MYYTINSSNLDNNFQNAKGSEKCNIVNKT